MQKEKRALVICGHDDDEAIGVGGTIRKLVDSGVQVTTMILCQGDEGYTSLEDKDKIVEMRRQERAASQKILGTSEYITCKYHDFDNLDCSDVYREVMRVVRQVRPHIVFTHLPTDYLSHRSLAQVVPEAVWQASWLCSLELGDPWDVKKIYQFSVLEPIPKPSHIVDISDTFQAKIQAMEAYTSQTIVLRDILQQMEAKARLYGSQIGVEFGEAFVRSQFIPIAVASPEILLEDVL